MHLCNCRSFQQHLRMLLVYPRPLRLASGVPGRIWKYLGALVRLTGVPWRFAYGFRTVLHFAEGIFMTFAIIQLRKRIDTENLTQAW